MMIRLIIRKIFSVLVFGIVTIGIPGCGGSTSGTGGVTVEGRLVELNNVPLRAAQITILQSGESAVSDSQGNFTINTPFASAFELLIEDSGFTVQSKVENIPENAETLVIVITVNRKDRSATSETKEIRQRERDDSSSDDQSESEDDSDKEDGSSNDDKDDSNNGSGGSNNDDSSNDNSSNNGGKDNGDHNSGDDSSDDHSNPSDGKEYRQEGLISAITSTTVTVNGVTFVPTTKSEYRDRDGKKATLAMFVTGTRVRVQGKLRNGIIELDKLEAEKD